MIRGGSYEGFRHPQHAHLTVRIGRRRSCRLHVMFGHIGLRLVLEDSWEADYVFADYIALSPPGPARTL